MAKVLLDKEMKEKSVLVSREEGEKMNQAMNLMSDHVERELRSHGNDEA